MVRKMALRERERTNSINVVNLGVSTLLIMACISWKLLWRCPSRFLSDGIPLWSLLLTLNQATFWQLLNYPLTDRHLLCKKWHLTSPQSLLKDPELHVTHILSRWIPPRWNEWANLPIYYLMKSLDVVWVSENRRGGWRWRAPVAVLQF